MDLFPIGTLDTTSYGTLDGIGSLALWEPTGKCQRSPVHTSLVSQADSNYLITRQKAKVYHTLTYGYDTLWTKEYRIIERFFKNRKGRVSSFYLVDFSNMQRASMTGITTRTVTFGGSRTFLDTTLFTTTEPEGGNYCCVWNPLTAKFQIGKVTTITSNTSLIFTATYGDLAATTTNIVVCPMYEVYFVEDQLKFDPQEFNPNDDDYGGWTYVGSISFIQKGVN